MVSAAVTYLDRGTIRMDENFVLEHATVGTATDPNPETERIEGPVYNLVIDHPEATILWDTGSHPEAGDGHWPAGVYAAFEHADAVDRDLPTALDDAGYELADIDCVIASHLHFDHAGGLHNFAGTDVPVYVHEAELKHAYYAAKTGADGGYIAGDFDHDLDWRVLHRDRERHFADLDLLHLPGHSPGLLGVRLDVDSYGTALLIGDQADIRANFEDERAMGGGLLWSKREWYDSLRRVKDLRRRTDAAVFCGHDPGDADRLRNGLV